ncbi:MAG: hypothetical protein PF961_05755 [Planctomycetota bacterium]|nr:hypothetical protein [Planctomycetota bacterium]
MTEGGEARLRRGGPPRLRLDLFGKLKVLALANVIPLTMVTWLGLGIYQGDVAIRTDVPVAKVGFICAVLLISCLVIGVSSWILLPVVRWLRDYPRWFLDHDGSAALWLVPAGVGWVIWFGSYIVVTVCAIASIGLIVVGLWALIGVATAVKSEPPGPLPAPPSAGTR